MFKANNIYRGTQVSTAVIKFIVQKQYKRDKFYPPSDSNDNHQRTTFIRAEATLQRSVRRLNQSQFNGTHCAF